jgi:hypothetical protein
MIQGIVLGSQATYIVYTMPVCCTYEMIRDHRHNFNRIGLTAHLVYTAWLVQKGYGLLPSLFLATFMVELLVRTMLLSMLMAQVI